MPIYTRTGDRGQTSLLDGTRVSKANARVEAYGTIDELNTSVGAAVAFLNKTKFKKVAVALEEIQRDLFEIGSALANPNASIETARPHPNPLLKGEGNINASVKGEGEYGLEKRPLEFERLIDDLTDKLPELKNFILPGGGKTGAYLHICRTLARRSERRIVALIKNEEVDQAIVIYINRLSDLFFTMARYVNFKEKKRETKWFKK